MMLVNCHTLENSHANEMDTGKRSEQFSEHPRTADYYD